MRTTLPETMQAVRLDPQSERLSLQEVPVPRPGPGQVLVRMAASPINPSDLNFIRGRTESQNTEPITPGFEGSGRVVAAGPGILPRLWLGKRVACAATPGAGGTWAEYLVTSAAQSFPLQRSLSLEQGSMLFVNPLTALAFFDMARQGKHRAIVNNAAASALGQMVLRLGQQRGVPVIHIVRRSEQANFLRSLGARYVLNSSDPGFPDTLRSLANELKATLFLDAVAGEATQQFLEASPDGSTILLYAHLSGEPRLSNSSSLVGKRLEGFYLPNWLARRNPFQILMAIRQVQNLASTTLQTTVQKRFPLSQAQEAVETYRQNMGAGKVLLVADPEAVSIRYVLDGHINRKHMS